MALSTKNSRPLLKRPQTAFERMQEAEYEWWMKFMAGPLAKERMYALYGARYFGFFFDELHNAGKTVEFGAGPLPVMAVMRCPEMLAVDTLYPRYIEAGLTYTWMPWFTNAYEVPEGYFDTALLLNVLDHTDNPQELVAFAQRSLRPGGQALVFVHCGQADDKHRLTHTWEVKEWFADWETVKENLQRTVYDPVAFMGVYRA